MQQRASEDAGTFIRFMTIAFALCTLFVVAKVILRYDVFYVPWPGRQVLPSILYLKGFLPNDFYAVSTNGSIYELAASVLARLMWGDLHSIVIQYSIYSTVLEILCTFLTALAIWRIAADLMGEEQTGTKDALTLLLPTIPVLLIIGNYVPLGLILPKSAAWGLPLDRTLNPQGLSWLITFSAICLSLFAGRFGALTFIAVAFAGFCATIVHPVIPLVGIVLLASLALLSQNHEMILKAWRGTFTMLGTYVLAVVIIMISFPDAGATPENFFEIYVAGRHPHHYLPSHYLTLPHVVILAAQTALVLFFLHLIRHLSTKTIAVVLLLALAPHLAQFLLVEQLQIGAFVKLGPSRLIMVFNLIYLCALFGLMVLLLGMLNDWRQDHGIVRAVYRVVRWLTVPAGIASVGLLAAVILLNYRYKQNDLPTRPAAMIANAIQEAGWGQYDVQPISLRAGNLDFREVRLREVGGMSVYSDSYFPFALDAMEEWSERGAVTSDVETCLVTNEMNESCLEPLRGRALVVISKGTPLTSESVPVAQTSDGDYWITRIGVADG